MSCPSCGEMCRDLWHTIDPAQTPSGQRELVTTRLIEAMGDYNANTDRPLAGFEEARTVIPGRVLFRMDGDSYVVRVTLQPDEREKDALAEYEFALARGLSDHEARDLAWPEAGPKEEPDG